MLAVKSSYKYGLHEHVHANAGTRRRSHHPGWLEQEAVSQRRIKGGMQGGGGVWTTPRPTTFVSLVAMFTYHTHTRARFRRNAHALLHPLKKQHHTQDRNTSRHKTKTPAHTTKTHHHTFKSIKPTITYKTNTRTLAQRQRSPV